MIPTEEEIEAKAGSQDYPYHDGFMDCAEWILERLRHHLIEWIPVEDERRPEDGENIQVYSPYEDHTASGFRGPSFGFLVFEKNYANHITHWARVPLPNPEK